MLRDVLVIEHASAQQHAFQAHAVRVIDRRPRLHIRQCRLLLRQSLVLTVLRPPLLSQDSIIASSRGTKQSRNTDRLSITGLWGHMIPLGMTPGGGLRMFGTSKRDKRDR